MNRRACLPRQVSQQTQISRAERLPRRARCDEKLADDGALVNERESLTLTPNPSPSEGEGSPAPLSLEGEGLGVRVGAAPPRDSPPHRAR